MPSWTFDEAFEQYFPDGSDDVRQIVKNVIAYIDEKFFNIDIGVVGQHSHLPAIGAPLSGFSFGNQLNQDGNINQNLAVNNSVFRLYFVNNEVIVAFPSALSRNETFIRLVEPFSGRNNPIIYQQKSNDGYNFVLTLNDNSFKEFTGIIDLIKANIENLNPIKSRFKNQNLTCKAGLRFAKPNPEQQDRTTTDVNIKGNKTMEALNRILYGPPGTGKTYETIERALDIIAIKNSKEDSKEELMNALAAYKKDKSKSDRKALKKVFNDYVATNQIHFVTFHQSYTYEDFIEGIKPKMNSDDVSYEIAAGIFKKVCNLARGLDENGENKSGNKAEDPNLQSVNNSVARPYVLIIDEINRGNISKIFGELITLIEDSKRKPGYLNPIDTEEAYEEISAQLPYSGDRFFVPDNVFILGTMNTADKSIAQMDLALRRRFVFEELMPNPELLSPVADIDLKRLLETINKRIAFLRGRDFTIGHAYFINCKDIQSIVDTVKNKVIPLLQEYFYEDWKKIQLILGSQIVEEDASQTFDKIFGDQTPNPGVSTKSADRYRIKESIEKDDLIKIYSNQENGNTSDNAAQ
jgi:hypothetical protein